MKIKHMIFLKLLNVIKIAEIFIQNVFKLHRLSDIIIFNHENQFVVIFWKMLCMWFEINSWFSMTYHSEINDQIKNANMIMKQYL